MAKKKKKVEMDAPSCSVKGDVEVSNLAKTNDISIEEALCDENENDGFPMPKKKKKFELEAHSSSVKGDVEVSNVAKDSDFSIEEDPCAENENDNDFANDSSSISYYSNSDFSDEEIAPENEYLHENFCLNDVCENAPVKSVALDELCKTAVCENAAEKNSNKEMETDPATISSLSPAAIPFMPGSIDAVLSACGGFSHVRPASHLPEVGVCSQDLCNSAVGGAAVEKPRPNAWSAPLPQVMSRLAPVIFPTLDEPEESYKTNGVIAVDEVEAAELSAMYDNVLVGRVVGRNFSFNWLDSQLREKWGEYKGFRVVDLGVGCFMLHFEDKESRDKVWLGGPWHVAGCLVGLDKWTGKFFPSMNPDMHVPTWIRAPGLPAHFWGEKTLKRIAKEIGEPLYIDAFTKARHKPRFARFCVRRNLAKPLIGGVWLRSEATGDFFQKITYEDVTSVCTSCGLAWHGYDDCKVKKDKGIEVDINNPLAGLDKWTLVEASKPQQNFIRRRNEQQQGNVVWKQKRTRKQKAPAKENIKSASIEKDAEPFIPNDKEDIDNHTTNDNALQEFNLVNHQQASLKGPLASQEVPDLADSFHHGESSGVKEHKKSKKRDKSCSNKVKTAEDYLEDDVRQGRSKSRRSSKFADSEDEDAHVRRGRKKSKSKSRARHARNSEEEDAAGETPSRL